MNTHNIELPDHWQSFQYNEVWGAWEQVIPSAADEHGVVKAYTEDQVRAAIEADRQARQASHTQDIPAGSGDPAWQCAMAHRMLTQAGVPQQDSECALSVVGRIAVLLGMNGLRLEGKLGGPLKCVSDRQARGEPVAWHSKQYGVVWMAVKPGNLVVGTQWFIQGRQEPVAEVVSPVSLVWHVATSELEHGTVFYTAPQPQQIHEYHSGSTQMFLDALTLARDNARGFWNENGPDTDSLPEIDLAIDTARAMLEAAPGVKP